MRKEERKNPRSLFSVGNFFMFWLFAALVAGCSMLLFISGTGIPEEIIRHRAPAVFINIIILSTLLTAFDVLRRNFTVRRPVERILEGTRKIRQGDFTVRIEPVHLLNKQNEFDIIIDDLNAMTRELAGVETLRTDFISNVSHELKTPLSVIQNYATLLKAPGLSEEKRLDYAGIVMEASRRLSDLITNILRLNKLENQEIYPNQKVYDLGEQLCECLLYFESQWENKGLEIETDLESDILIEADEEFLSLVWNNLFSNAVKFTDEGGAIGVSLHGEGPAAVVRIRDTGCGISPEIREHMFDKFYQGDTSHAAQGNGLGLALVKRVMDIMGGEVSVESRIGEGSTFTVRLNRYKKGKSS